MTMVQRHVRGLRLAFGFLTRIPVAPVDVRDGELGTSVAYFSVVGSVLGGILYAAAWWGAGTVNPALLAILLVAVLAAVTGGLHLDGIADVFDGVSGGRGDRSRTLEIMRDSRIGSHGATALILLLATKVVAVGHLIVLEAWMLVAIAPVVGRAFVAVVIVCVPYARDHGLGTGFRQHARWWHAGVALMIATIPVGVAGTSGLAAAAGAMVCTGLFLIWIYRLLGGATGDVYGAVVEVGEASFWFFATVVA